MDYISLQEKHRSDFTKDDTPKNEDTPALADTKKSHQEYETIIAQLENEKLELIAQLSRTNQAEGPIEAKSSALAELTPSTIEITSTSPAEDHQTPISSDELKRKLEKTIEHLNEQALHLNGKLNEMTNLYEAAKQNELDEKNKIKHMDRSLKALKIEKDQFCAQITDLQERVALQAKDLQEAQTQRKLAVQEFTDVNEKVKELRSKNVKLGNDLLNKEDEVEDLKRACAEHKHEMDKRDKTIDEFKSQVASFKENLARLESERHEFLAKSKDKPDTEPVDPQVVLNEQLSKEIQLVRAQLAELGQKNQSVTSELAGLGNAYRPIHIFIAICIWHWQWQC